jgi:hypothetical protein
VGVALTILAVKVRSILVFDAIRDEVQRADAAPNADRALREIEAERQAGTITREEANQRRQAVLQSVSKPAETGSDSSQGR